ncbi:properdin [Biomphalaria pfeifferi]|uniref:Properdin n=1 Tax=Biomphalaria pfeifferi TaxID=112525 RepID=A0AAD8FFK2_BIOPF|nr:properdin [Biomphalaria pfeifferi]
MGKENWQVGFIPIRSSFTTLHTNHWASFGCYLWQLSSSSCSVTFADFDSKTFPLRRKRQDNKDKVKDDKVKDEVKDKVKDDKVKDEVKDEVKDDKVKDKVKDEVKDDKVKDKVKDDKVKHKVKDGKVNETSTAEEERNITKTTIPKVCTEGCEDAETKEDEELMAKVVHGNWATWEEWLCTENCNASHQERRRLCDDPAPAFGGEQCSGDNIESKASNCYKNKLDCPTGESRGDVR